MEAHIILSLFSFVSMSSAFYFHVAEREEKCIIEDIPSDTLITDPVFNKERIHLDIRIGEHDLDAVIAQAKDKVNEVNYKLEHLTEQIEQIIKEQNYQREREENFRMTSEDTNSNVLWWALAQMLILILVGIFQMKSLKDFFIAKKLV
ncbi:transmembrane emp24 domain-containing protein 11-like [Gracilinanus agilis]|uniref:transmembrane emp24 domain-containing protein 11-like n=1 Tax=Gracilinanus agilis TaxID=191870 RepID=UPI001CFDDEFA|nr:transmembrane emp24 domain-containing protein 11-like [Gracilinanus agilis]